MRCARPRPEESVPFILEAVSLVRRELRPDQAVIGFCGGPFTVAGYLVEGKPSREFLEVKRLMYAEPDALARADGEADRDVRTVRRGEGAGGRRRDPALRLLGRRPLPGRLRGVRPALLGADPRGRRLPDDPLRHRHGNAARADGRGRRRRDRARLADPARLGLGDRRRGSRRAGEPRRRAPLRAVGARGAGDPGRARPRRGTARPHLQPRPRRHARHRPGRARSAARVRPRADGAGRSVAGSQDRRRRRSS